MHTNSTLPSSIKRFRLALILSLIGVYLVIAAGAVVRMTGSGMGCPDWPKCFGYLVPPTRAGDLQWQEGRAYSKGQAIIRQEKLWIARTDFTTSSYYNPENWQLYPRHDYAVFNVAHTWTEYINRLLGALAGLATLGLALLSVPLYKTHRNLVFISWAVVLGMGFQGWLGATVVYSVLEPLKITLHMLMALLLVAMLLYLLHASAGRRTVGRYERLTSGLLMAALGLSLLQILLGTQVREFVDQQQKLLGGGAKSVWLEAGPVLFDVHRSLSLLLLLLSGYLAYRICKYKLDLPEIYWVLGVLGLEALTGIAMTYFDFPWGSQALHLLLATFLFSLQFYLVLRMAYAGRSPKSS